MIDERSRNLKKTRFSENEDLPKFENFDGNTASLPARCQCTLYILYILYILQYIMYIFFENVQKVFVYINLA